jgi:hypothetical protein
MDIAKERSFGIENILIGDHKSEKQRKKRLKRAEQELWGNCK